jgi:hypothetical protein
MHPELLRAREVIEAVAGPLDVRQLTSGPAGKWSPAHILEHLTLAFRLNTRAIGKLMESGTPRTRQPGWKEWIARTLVVDLGYFPRARAPEGVVPSGSIPPPELLDALLAALSALDEALSRAETRFGLQTPIVNHPYFAALTVAQWRRFHTRHTLHHMRQIGDRT